MREVDVWFLHHHVQSEGVVKGTVCRVPPGKWTPDGHSVVGKSWRAPTTVPRCSEFWAEGQQDCGEGAGPSVFGCWNAGSRVGLRVCGSCGCLQQLMYQVYLNPAPRSLGAEPRGAPTVAPSPGQSPVCPLGGDHIHAYMILYPYRLSL